MALNLALVTQIVKLIPDSVLAPLLKQYNRKATATRYTLRHHLLVLLSSHLGGADSVRDIANALIILGEHDAKELGIRELPSKSTISYQNRQPQSWHPPANPQDKLTTVEQKKQWSTVMTYCFGRPISFTAVARSISLPSLV